MKKLVYLLVFLLFCFSVNLSFYYTSEDYRFFLKKIKYPDEVVTINNNLISDNIVLENKTEIETETIVSNEIKLIDSNTGSLVDTGIIIKENKDEFIGTGLITNEINIDNELLELEEEKENIEKEEKEIASIIEENKKELSIIDRDILNKFNFYQLEEATYISSLLDITTEYPEKYIEYNSPKLDIVFFLENNFQNIYELFDIISYDLPFIVNKVDNFGDKSFYINLDETDGFIRLIIEKNNRVFGLKILKSEYNNLKEILHNL